MQSVEYPHILGLLFIFTVLNCYLGWIPEHVSAWWQHRKAQR